MDAHGKEAHQHATKVEDLQEEELTQHIEAWKLGTQLSDGIDKMQTHWACGLKRVDRFESAHGTYYSVVEQNGKRTLKTNPQ
jgi:hypothetical protein